MINTYYLIEDGQQTGPFSHTDLMDQGIAPDALVLSPISADWQSASDLPEFFEYFQSRGIYLPTMSNVANFWWRLLAYLIDYVLVIIFAVLLGVLFGTLSHFIPALDDINPRNQDLGWRLMLFMLITFYNAIFEATELQGTIGKTICKLRVVNKQGTRISFATALGRNLGKILSSLICGMGFLTIFWDRYNQGWHDQLAKTYVIRNV